MTSLWLVYGSIRNRPSLYSINTESDLFPIYNTNQTTTKMPQIQDPVPMQDTNPGPDHSPEQLPSQQSPDQHKPQLQDGEDHDPTNSQDQDQDQDQESRTNEARTAFTASLTAIGHNYDQPLQTRAETLHEMDTILRGQEEQVSSATAGLGRQNAEMEGTLDTAREGLKEIGDVQNWAELLERDLLVVEEVLRDVEGSDRGSSVDVDVDVDGSGSSGGSGGSGGGGGDGGGGERPETEVEHQGTRATDGKKGWFKWW